MNGNLPKLIIGFITYGKSTAKYLPYFLSSLKAQTYKNFQIIAIDNTEERNNENLVYIKNNYADIEIVWAGKNLGFAKAYNEMIDKAVAYNADYFLALNPDMVLEPDSIEELLLAFDNEEKLGSVAPKILKWDFEQNKKTDIIDSCGIILRSGLRFVDLGQNEKDDKLFDNSEIIGPSGAAAMYNVSALQKVIEKGKYFDELMFMYKEDCDLAYRLYLAGYGSKLVPDSVIYHARTASASGEDDLSIALNRKNKSQQVREWSFLNQQILILKFWRRQNLYNKLSIIWYEFRMLVYILLFERYLLKQFENLKKLKKEIVDY